MLDYLPPKARPRAFTLIELLVVVSIIVILIAILLPSLGKARENARKTVCQTRLKAWATGFHLYAADWSGALPLDGGDGTSAVPIGVWSDTRLWFNGVTQYMGTGDLSYDQLQGNAVNRGNAFDLPKGGMSSIFICPSSLDAASNTAQTGDTVTNGFFMTTGYFSITKGGPFTDPPRPMLMSFGMNSQLRDWDYSSWQNYFQPFGGPTDNPRLSLLNYASTTALIAEKRTRQDELPANHPSYTKALTQSKVTANRFTARHSKGGSIAMADGHVEWFLNAALDNPNAQKTKDYNLPNVIIWNPNLLP